MIPAVLDEPRGAHRHGMKIRVRNAEGAKPGKNVVINDSVRLAQQHFVTQIDR
jgi:hypothetical protein